MVKKTPPQHSQTATAELPYPQIQSATNNNILYPLDAEHGTAASGLLGQNILLHWAIKDQQQPTFEPIAHAGSASGTSTVPIPWPYVSSCIGRTVLIWYTAIVGGQASQSLVLELEIQQIREADLRESLPKFFHAKLEWSTLWLNMFDFQGDESIEIKAWPMIQAGQRLFVTVAGDQHQVPYAFIWVAFDHVVTAEEADPAHEFKFRLPRSWLAQREDYSALTTHMGVIWDGSEPVLPTPDDPVHENPLPINAQDFHLRTTTLLRVDPALHLQPPHLKESVDCGAEGWLVNPVNTVEGAHIVIAYDGIHAGDRVCPNVEGAAGAGSPALECRTVQEGENSLEFKLAPSVISANFRQKMVLSYVVYSRSGTWLSPSREVTVLDISGLPGPMVEQATGTTLDLNTFSGDPDGVVIPWNYIALGQLCWLWVTGTLEDGSPYRFEVLEGEQLSEAWLVSGVNTPLPRQELQKLADCSDFEVHFAVSFNGRGNQADAKQFPVLTLGIAQEDLVLDAPAVREAVGSQLTVYNGRDGVTVRVAYALISSRHSISLCWQRTDGTCLPLAPKPGSTEPSHVDFQIPREAVIRGIGKTVKINYTVNSRCKVATSPDLDLQISVPVRLPAPVVPQATDSILDLATFSGDADITVDPWWFILPGQRVWLRAEGTKVDGTAYTINVYLGEVLTATEVNAGLNKVLSRSELGLLKHDSSLIFTCKVTADGSARESEAVVFIALELVLRRPLIIIEERFEDQTTRSYTAGGVVETPTMNVTFVSGPFTAGILAYEYNQFSSGQTYVLCRDIHHAELPQKHRFDFKYMLEYVKFAWVWKQFPGQVIFYDDRNHVLAALDFPEENRGGFWVEYSASNGHVISSMEVLVEDYSFIDNFTMHYRP